MHSSGKISSCEYWRVRDGNVPPGRERSVVSGTGIAISHAVSALKIEQRHQDNIILMQLNSTWLTNTESRLAETITRTTLVVLRLSIKIFFLAFFSEPGI